MGEQEAAAANSVNYTEYMPDYQQVHVILAVIYPTSTEIHA